MQAEALAHTHVSTAPLPTPLLTPSTPGQGQLAGNADPPKIGLFLQCVYYYILIKAAARGEHFYVLWPHMFHKVVPTKSGVRAQPARPHQAPLSSSLWPGDGKDTASVWKAGRLPQKGGTVSLAALRHFPTGTARGRGGAAEGSQPLLWSSSSVLACLGLYFPAAAFC